MEHQVDRVVNAIMALVMAVFWLGAHMDHDGIGQLIASFSATLCVVNALWPARKPATP